MVIIVKYIPNILGYKIMPVVLMLIIMILIKNNCY